MCVHTECVIVVHRVTLSGGNLASTTPMGPMSRLQGAQKGDKGRLRLYNSLQICVLEAGRGFTQNNPCT